MRTYLRIAIYCAIIILSSNNKIFGYTNIMFEDNMIAIPDGFVTNENEVSTLPTYFGYSTDIHKSSASTSTIYKWGKEEYYHKANTNDIWMFNGLRYRMFNEKGLLTKSWREGVDYSAKK